MAEWVRWQLNFGRSQIHKFGSRSGELFLHFFSKIFEIFIITTFLGVKNHEEHESALKKLLPLEKPFEINNF